MRSAKQILDGNRLDLHPFGDAVGQFREARCAAEGHAKLGGLVEQRANCAGRQGKIGDDQPLWPFAALIEPLHYGFQFVQSGKHLDAMDAAAQISAHLIDDSDHPVARHRVARQTTQEKLRIVAGPDQKQRHPTVSAAFPRSKEGAPRG